MLRRSTPALALVIALVALGSPARGQPAPPSTDGDAAELGFVPGELIVKLRPAEPGSGGTPSPTPTPQQRLERLRERVGAQRARAVPGLHRELRLSARARERLERRAARSADPEPTPRALQRNRARVEQQLSGLARAAILKFADDADLQALSAQLRADPEVEYAHPNYIATASDFTPNDPFFSTCCSWGQTEDDLWGLKLLEMEAAWGGPSDFSNAGEGVIVAVVDTGLDRVHPDIAANVWVNLGHGASGREIAGNGVDDDGNGYIDDVHGFDFTRSVDVNGDGDYDDPEDEIFPDPIDEHGHGTHVAGTIAAEGNNGTGIVGVAPRAQIMAVRGLGATGSGSFDGLAAAIVYAAVNGADVINNSWGCVGPCFSGGLVEDAVRLAHDMDAVVVFAAGNNASNAVLRSPQNMSETIAVSALTPTDERIGFSNFGPLVDVGAPGGHANSVPFPENVLSLEAAGALIPSEEPQLVVAPGYLRLRGTSMASPHAAGVAALLRGFDPTLSSEQIRQILRHASDPVATTSPFAGYGRVNGRKVLESTLNAEVLIETPATPSRELEGTVELRGFARGPNLQNVEISVGAGGSPSSFASLPTSYEPVTGNVSAMFDSSTLPDGVALLRIRADDGVRTYESTTGAIVDNLRFLAPAAGSTVSGEIGVVVAIGASPFLQRVVIRYQNALTGETETLLDTTQLGSPQLTTTLDTLRSIDSIHLSNVPIPGRLVTEPTLSMTATYVIDGQTVTATEAVAFRIDNDRITSPALGERFGDTSPFTVAGTALHDVELQAAPFGGSWIPVATAAPGSFSLSVDPSSLGLDLELDNRLLLRLVADIDEDGQYEDTEQTALSLVLLDPGLGPAWPRSLGQSLSWAGVTVGNVDGVAPSEVVVTASGSPFRTCVYTTGSCVFQEFDPAGGIHLYDGDGSLDLQVFVGATMFQPPACLGNQAALSNFDGLPGNEIVWASFGQVAAIRHDGEPPAGFASDVFNDGLFDLEAHSDPAYTELYPCRPPIAKGIGAQRGVILQSRLFDVTNSLGGSSSTQHFLANRVLDFDVSGALVNATDKGAGRTHPLDAAVADVDADGSLEIVTYRMKLPDPEEGKRTSVLVYDAASLVLETEFDILGLDSLRGLMVGDLDGQPGLEIVLTGTTGGPAFTNAVYAFFNDGTPLPGTPHHFPLLETRALGDLDGDGDAEILVKWSDGPASRPDLAIRLAVFDFDGSALVDLPGWPVLLPPEVYGLGSILVGNIDDDPEQEVLYSANEILFYSVSGVSWPVLDTSYVAVLDADGTPWKGGWRRAAPGVLSIALGNIDSGAEMELALTSVNRYQNDPSQPGFSAGEVLAYSLDGQTSWTQWSHRFGNAQHTGAILRATPNVCNDAIDNDGDGLIDHPADPGCASEFGDTESPECNDGVDNDGDGSIDFDGGPNGEPPDPQCGQSWWHTEGFIEVCGLLGVEVLPVLGWSLWRRRRARRLDPTAPHELA